MVICITCVFASILMFLASCDQYDGIPPVKNSMDELIDIVNSPGNIYSLYVYRQNGGMTTDFAILCHIKNNETGKTRGIYFQYHERKAKVEWLDDATLVINGVELDAETGTYDYRM